MAADDSVVEQFCCAACGARLRFVKALTPGRRVWCPTCRAPLVLAPAPPTPAAPTPEPAPPVAIPDISDEAPPWPRPRRPRPKPISRFRALAVGLAATGGFLLLIGAAVLVLALSGVFDAGGR
jgi:hypothetical protein